jgi:uncharacterized Zn finger protein
MGWYGFDDDGPGYVPAWKRVATARRQAEKEAKRSGRQAEPVVIDGREIVTTFWGKAWCRNLESYSDFSNRLPRGRTYARNGSVADLHVTEGRIDAVVAGSRVYDVVIEIEYLSPTTWRAIKRDCATSIGSLLDLLAGRLADDVMRRLTQPADGMFPTPRQIELSCSCPDGARLCKHLAAVLYGIGHRLDTQPELLFLLRGVNQQELVSVATKESVSQAVRGQAVSGLADADLGDIFGIELGTTEVQPVTAAKRRRTAVAGAVKKKSAKKKNAKKTSARKKTVKKKAAKPDLMVDRDLVKKVIANAAGVKKTAAKKPAVKKSATKASKKSAKKAAKKSGKKPAAAKASIGHSRPRAEPA